MLVHSNRPRVWDMHVFMFHAYLRSVHQVCYNQGPPHLTGPIPSTPPLTLQVSYPAHTPITLRTGPIPSTHPLTLQVSHSAHAPSPYRPIPSTHPPHLIGPIPSTRPLLLTGLTPSTCPLTIQASSSRSSWGGSSRALPSGPLAGCYWPHARMPGGTGHAHKEWKPHSQ